MKSYPEQVQEVLPEKGEAQSLALPPRGSSGPVFFDLETVPDYSRSELFDLEPLPTLPPVCDIGPLPTPADVCSKSIDDVKSYLSGINPPEEWLIAIEIEEAKSKKPRKGLMDALKECRGQKDVVAQAVEARRKKLSTTPEFCRIAAIGIGIGLKGDPVALLCPDERTERDALAYWWDVADRVKGPLCGYNILGFDLPVILVRSAILGITPTVRGLHNVRPWDDSIAIDLMLCRFGSRGASKLKDLARYYGLPVDAEGVDGSQVEDLFEKDPEKVAEYVKSDVTLTRRLYLLWKGYFC